MDKNVKSPKGKKTVTLKDLPPKHHHAHDVKGGPNCGSGCAPRIPVGPPNAQ